MLLKIEDVSKIYDVYYEKVKALDGVSFSVEKGEFIAVTGASGSGKSTLLHIIGGVDRPTSGAVYLDGVNVYGQNEKELARYRREKVSVIYQFGNLLPQLNVSDNIVLPLKLAGKAVDQRMFVATLAETGLKDREFYYPNQLSGGQRQRAAVARAVMACADVILADEPTGSLDSKNSDGVMELLKRYNKEKGQTLIVVTHDTDIARTADRIIAISDGRIVKDERK